MHVELASTACMQVLCNIAISVWPAAPLPLACTQHRYEDDRDEGEWFLYTGSGGRDLSGNKRTNKVTLHERCHIIPAAWWAQLVRTCTLWTPILFVELCCMPHRSSHLTRSLKAATRHSSFPARRVSLSELYGHIRYGSLHGLQRPADASYTTCGH